MSEILIRGDVAIAQIPIALTFLAQILDRTPDPVYVKNRQHCWILVNQAYCQLFECDRAAILGRVDEAELVWMMDEHIFATEEEDVSEDYITGPQGEIKYLSTKKICLSFDDGEKYIVATIRDLTSHKQVEEALRRAEVQASQQTQALQAALAELQRTQLQLIQSEKMSSLGQLVSGLAHELNNPMNFIQGNLVYARSHTQDLLKLINLYREGFPEPPIDIQAFQEGIDLDYLIADLPKIFASAESGSQRIQEIIESLKVFSRLDESEVKIVDLHEGLNSALLLLQSRLKFKMNRISIKVICNFGELPPIECYASALNQVFMNLLMNAIDAIDEQALQMEKTAVAAGLDPYRSEVYTQYVPVITIGTRLDGERNLEIKISDNGVGIPIAVQSRMFDPFFTTKAIGVGTGLGLPLTYQIITEQHQGQIRCQSLVGLGTTFSITIPRHLAV
jgi:two-component system, NtrC family, sensor kinase